jgi:hypothetical protein
MDFFYDDLLIGIFNAEEDAEEDREDRSEDENEKKIF